MWKIFQGKFEKNRERLNSSERKVMPILRTLHIRFLLRSKLDSMDEYGGNRERGSHD
jgi:hypothetical protein